MNPNKPNIWIATHVEYVPYFYSAGIIQKYLEQKKDLYSAPTSNYDFSSDLSPGRTRSVPQTVEDVIRGGYFSVPKSDLETAIISDKKHTSWLGLDDVIHQIRHRHEIYSRSIYDLELSKCSVINGLYSHEAYHGPSDSKVEYSVNKRLDKLYSEQREERLNFWRDVSKLKLLLPEQAQNYLSAYRKVSILENFDGDGP